MVRISEMRLYDESTYGYQGGRQSRVEESYMLELDIRGLTKDRSEEIVNKIEKLIREYNSMDNR